MNAVLPVLSKSIIAPFYRAHAGMLIFVFLVMFGTVESRYLVNYHQTLILGMFTSEVFMLAVCFIWTLYSLKILHFILWLLRKPEYVFLTDLMLVSRMRVLGQIFITVLSCFLPVLVYTIFIYLIGISEHYYYESLGILAFQISICFITTLVIVLFLRTQHKFSWAISLFRMPNRGGRIGFYISYFVNEEKIALLISKAFSLSLLYIVREATESGDDFRILGLTWVFVLLSHTFLVPKVRMFEDRYLSLIKSLPISTVKTCALYFIFYAGLMLPELMFSISMAGNVFEVILLMLLSAGIQMFIHAYLLKPTRDVDQFSTFLFWLFILSFFVILSKGISILSVVLIVAACIRITLRYYEYEPVID